MLPVLVVAAAASGAAGYTHSRRRSRWLTSKPQRRFQLRLTDNSDTPFQHLQLYPCCQNSNSTVNSNSTPHNASNNADADQHSSEQQQDASQPAAHPYAAQIAAILQHPCVPCFITPTHDGDDTTSTSSGTHGAVATAEPFTLPPEPPALDSSPCVWVDTPRKLQAMLCDLQGVSCIALDTEHSQRSYLGMLCLLQLSTGTVDYLVDALALHDHLHLLRPLMSDPAVLKVLHGGANDIGWLQRDAHVYLVNVFDTEKAALVLGREERSLAHLLRRYCGVTQDKAHQTADWRLRPLAPQLAAYARGDVHWLLRLAGLMVAELQARSPSTTGDPCAPGPMLTSVLQKSNTLTLRLYHKTPAAVTVSNATAAAMRRYSHQHAQRIQQQQQQQQQRGAGWFGVGGRGSLPVVAAAGATADATSSAGGSSNNSSSTAAITSAAAAAVVPDELQLMLVRQRLAAVISWRDQAARAEDEGPQYILPDAAMLELVSQPPTTAKQLLAVITSHCDTLDAAVQHLPAAPRWAVSQPVRKAAKQLVQLLQNPASGAAAGVVFGGSGQQLAAAAGGSGSDSEVAGDATAAGSSSGAVGGNVGTLPPLMMVNGQLVAANSSAAATGSNSSSSGGKGRSRRDDGQFRERMIKKFSAKTQVYDNCRMLSTTGDLLCYCDARKLQWYLDKGLAELVVEEPPTIRLLFEHKNADQQMGLDGFYSTSRANRCVVCGCEEHYLRYRVIPACYRRCFPAHLKSHRSHDIILLCVDCHQMAHKAAERMKREVAATYNVPLKPTHADLQQQQQQHLDHHQQQQQRSSSAAEAAAAGNDSDSDSDAGDEAAGEAAAAAGVQGFMSSYHKGDPQPVSGVVLANQARAAAIALVRFGDNIPPARKQQLEGIVARYVGRDGATPAAATGDSSCGGGVGLPDIEAALLAGLGERKRAKTLKKLRKNLKQMQQQQEGSTGASSSAAAAVSDETANSTAANGHNHEQHEADGMEDNNTSTSTPYPQHSSALLQLRRPEEQGHLWHGQQVVAAAMARGGEQELHQLVKRFRQAFVVACQPKYLPANWAVDAIDSRQFGEHSVYAAAAAAGAEQEERAGEGIHVEGAAGEGAGEGVGEEQQQVQVQEGKSVEGRVANPTAAQAELEVAPMRAQVQQAGVSGEAAALDAAEELLSIFPRKQAVV